MDWTPTIANRQGPLYQRIVSALADDIAAGHVHHGQALPTHRSLARALGVDLTTVTRAYAEARRLGLTEARVGRGTFAVVPGPASARTRMVAAPGIDLSMNLPPQPAEADLDGRLARTLAEIRNGPGLAAYLTYQQPGGTARERQIATEWIGALWPMLTAERVLLAPGTQAALFALLLTHAAPGATLLTEALTYPGIKAAAHALGVRIVGVAMDEAGVVPEALDRAARRHDASLVYLMPTIHNPTTVTMPAARRHAVAEVIAARGLTLIEDDPYSFLAPGQPPLAALVPERAFLAASVAKCLAPGLRVSIVVAPDGAAADKLAQGLRAAQQMAVPLMGAVATRWMRDGTAEAIVAAIRAEAVARQALARSALAGTGFAAHTRGLHVWLPLPETLAAGAFAAELHGRGLAVVTADAFATDVPPPGGIRLALGAAKSRPQLARALDILSSALMAAAAG